MKDVDFRGTWTALITPFDESGAVDNAALSALCERQVAAGITGLVPCGTTGETPTLSQNEQLEVIRVVVEAAKGRVPIVAGTGSNNTAASIAQSKAALAVGVDAVMVVMPYYNKPSQRGMIAHVRAVADAVDCPVMMYNVPSRSVVTLSVDSVEAICEACPNVVALKDATGNVMHCQHVHRRLGDRLVVLSGDDALTVPMIAAGAKGVVSVSSNVIPERVVGVTNLALSDDIAAARLAHLDLLSFHEAMFVEPNPAPAKCALSLLGHCRGDVRLPLLAASDDTGATVFQELSRLGVMRG